MPLALSAVIYSESHDLNAQGVPFSLNHLFVESRHGLKQHNPEPGIKNTRDKYCFLVMLMTKLLCLDFKPLNTIAIKIQNKKREELK